MNEAELLFTHLLGCERPALYRESHRSLSAAHARFIAGVLRRRAAGEPLQYILGETEFMGLRFVVDPSVLIPRPETERLVETALAYGRRPQTEDGRGGTGVRILDVGTGSGCIAVSLAALLRNSSLTAIDISEDALRMARKNARMHGVDSKIHFLKQDLSTLHQASSTTHRFDIVVSNPPYIRTAEIATLQPEVRREPFRSLDGGEDGLDFYRMLLARSPEFLRRGGLLIVEIGYGQLERIRGISFRMEGMQMREVVKDYSGIERVVVFEKVKS